MRIKISTSLYFLICLCGGYKSIAQPIPADLIQMMKVSRNQKNFSTEISYTLFQTYLSKVPYSNESGKLIRGDGMEYFQVSSAETFVSPSISLTVDNEIKTITLMDGRNLTELLPVSPEIVFSTCRSIRRLLRNDSQQGYMIFFKKGNNIEMSKMSVIFNKESFEISEITLYYSYPALQDYGIDTNPKMKILYSGFSSISEKDIPEFKLEHYLVTVNQNNFSGAGKYSDFEITDFRTPGKKQ